MLLPELNLPVGFAGKDGFYWWIGQIETDVDKKFSNRYKVRIVGQHVKSCTAVSVEDLPWAVVMLPVTAPSSEGNSSYHPARLQKGDWVVGFFLDGAEGQHPVIMGSFQKVTKSTTNTSLSNNNSTAECLAFTRYVPDTNPKMTVPEGSQDATARPGIKNGEGSGSSTILNATNDQQSGTNPHGRYACVLIADPTCEDTSSSQSKFEQTLSEFFGAVSKNGGQLGTQMLSSVTGKLYDYTGAAGGYIRRVFGLARTYIKAGKFQLLALIKKGVQTLISFCLGIPIPTSNPKDGKAVKLKNQGILSKLFQWLNEQLGLINCAIAGLEDRLLDFLTNLIYGLLTEVVSAATCKIEQIVSQIINEIESFLTDAISAILGPLQAILGIIASPLNILGAILQYIFTLFGISCTGPDKKCKKPEQSQFCTGAANNKKPGEDDFAALDKLIADVAAGGQADLQTSCTDYTTLPCPAVTTANVYGGEPGDGSGDPETPPPDVEDPFDNFFDSFNPPTDDGNRDGSDDIDEEVDAIPVNAAVNSTVGLRLTSNSRYRIALAQRSDYTWRGTLNINLSSTSSEVRTQDRYEVDVVSVIPQTETNIITYSLTADKTRVRQSETISFTLRLLSGSVPDGTVFNYFMFGFIQASDFANGINTGRMTMIDGVATANITISSQISIADEEEVLFSVTEAGLSRQFIIYNQNPVVTTPTEPPRSFVPPTLGIPEVDGEGRIIYIPIVDPGDPYVRPPFINIAGTGSGASATALLDDSGRLTKIKIERPGRNYVPNKSNKTSCVIDGFVVIRPGSGYTSEPTVTVNGEQGIARAIIRDGFVVDLEVINKTKTYEDFPAVRVFGGGGSGTRVISSLSCLERETYEEFALSVAPSGEAQVIDCP
jgi:hypothetical protein